MTNDLYVNAGSNILLIAFKITIIPRCAWAGSGVLVGGWVVRWDGGAESEAGP